MIRTKHIVVGPDRHGVTRHAISIANFLGDEIIRLDKPSDFDPAQALDADVVHIAYSDRLFASTCEESAIAYATMITELVANGIAISVTLHDLPNGDSPLEVRRRAAYSTVAASARGIVVSSYKELELLDLLNEHARSRRRIPLPIDAVDIDEASDSSTNSDVVVLGFIFPNRGYEHTLAELPDGVGLTALGGPSAGHEDLPAQLVATAESADHKMSVTGFVEDDDLSDALFGAGIPIAPNRRVAASASIGTWISHGRRPLVPISPYSLELDREWPGTIALYDADKPGALRTAIECAQADPTLTHIAAGTRLGLSLAEASAAYAEHFAATAFDRLHPLGHGRYVVPENRWDLAADLTPSEVPSASVIIPYFEAQDDLDRVLAALTRQTHPQTKLQVIVVDDGSSKSPDLTAGTDLDVTLLRQENLGFRAAAARNLGAAAAEGDILMFLDGDTVPEPNYVERMVRLPALLPDVLAVGRRRHADFTTDPPRELKEPAWLVDAYRESENLLNVDERSYRFIISAVMAIRKDLFNQVGGFSEEFTSYGGEDWEFANRAYATGAVLAHVRDAVAWHIGDEWALRSDAKDKNAETLALLRLIPDSVSRGGGQWTPYHSVVIQLRTDDTAAAMATIRSAFNSNADCGFWMEDQNIVEAIGDARVRLGRPPSDVLNRAQITADLVPCNLTALPDLIRLANCTGETHTPAGTFTARRAQQRSTRWSNTSLFGRRDLSYPVPFAKVDLQHELKHIYR